MRFTATGNAPPQTNDFAPIPEGRYTIRILTAEERDNKQSAGRGLNLGLEVMGPTHTGRRLWAYMATAHTNPDVAQRGMGQIEAMSHAVGLVQWEHERELVGQIGDVKVGIDRNDPTRNRIIVWITSSAPRTSTPAPRPTAPAYDDTQRRNGQLAAVANIPRATADFDDNVPF